jgi:hypothetical protein
MHIYANCGALHEKEKRKKGERTRLQFFAIVFVASFAYYIVPGHFFPSLSALSLICLLDMEALGHRSTDWCRVKWSWNWLFVFFNFKTQQQEKTKNYYRE